MTTKAKPILMSTPMVQACMRDIAPKTQTRRVANVPEYAYYKQGGLVWYDSEQNQETKKCPRYHPGDILWVRETWYYENHMHDLTAGEPDLSSGSYSHRYNYKADNPDCPVNVGVGSQGWKPSIFMPREAARLFLRMTDVRAERLQDISPQDCLAEGIMNDVCAACLNIHPRCSPQIDVDRFCGNDEQIVEQYADLWDHLNAKRDVGKYAWDMNPWVWVYTFEQIEKPADWPLTA